jgi:hypothetical protein
MRDEGGRTTRPRPQQRARLHAERRKNEIHASTTDADVREWLRPLPNSKPRAKPHLDVRSEDRLTA